jgi:hypothetical protein
MSVCMNMHLPVYVYVNVYVNANAYAYVYVYIWLQVERGSPLLPLANAFTLVTPWFFRRFQSVTLQSYYVDTTSCNVREGACTNPKPKNLPGIPRATLFTRLHPCPVYIGFRMFPLDNNNLFWPFSFRFPCPDTEKHPPKRSTCTPFP